MRPQPKRVTKLPPQLRCRPERHEMRSPNAKAGTWVLPLLLQWLRPPLQLQFHQRQAPAAVAASATWPSCLRRPNLRQLLHQRLQRFLHHLCQLLLPKALLLAYHLRLPAPRLEVVDLELEPGLELDLELEPALGLGLRLAPRPRAQLASPTCPLPQLARRTG